MREPTDLNRSVVVIANNESISATQQSDRHLRKIIVPQVKPEYHETSLITNGNLAVWEKEIEGQRPVIESQNVQLSWVDDRAVRKPHWHQFQIESYFSLTQTELVFRSVDDAGAEFRRIEFTGRVFIPLACAIMCDCRDRRRFCSSEQKKHRKGSI